MSSAGVVCGHACCRITASRCTTCILAATHSKAGPIAHRSSASGRSATFAAVFVRPRRSSLVPPALPPPTRSPAHPTQTTVSETPGHARTHTPSPGYLQSWAVHRMLKCLASAGGKVAASTVLVSGVVRPRKGQGKGNGAPRCKAAAEISQSGRGGSSSGASEALRALYAGHRSPSCILMASEAPVRHVMLLCVRRAQQPRRHPAPGTPHVLASGPCGRPWGDCVWQMRVAQHPTALRRFHETLVWFATLAQPAHPASRIPWRLSSSPAAVHEGRAPACGAPPCRSPALHCRPTSLRVRARHAAGGWRPGREAALDS